MCFTSVALVTDRDAGVEDGTTPSVTQEEVFSFFAANVERLRSLIGDLIARVPARPECACGADVPPLP
jgi:5'-methylthioadenosine phosphorylase